MTIDELIARLEEVKAAGYLDGDTEVKVAYQPNWPLVGEIQMVTDPHEVLDPLDEEAVEAASLDVLWIAIDQGEDGGSPYAPKLAWGETGE